jgi:DNA-binding transcriptional regulator LsrR (DeoR family)
MSEAALSAELKKLLGLDDFVRLAEAYGGTRLFVPARDAETKLARTLGQAVAARLAERYAGTYLRVPLAREERARQYRQRNASNAEIARRLGITESGVDKLFSRMADKPAKGVDPRQGNLFPTS